MRYLLRYFDRLDLRAKFIIMYIFMIGIALADAVNESTDKFMWGAALLLLGYVCGYWMHTFKLKRRLKDDASDTEAELGEDMQEGQLVYIDHKGKARKAKQGL